MRAHWVHVLGLVLGACSDPSTLGSSCSLAAPCAGGEVCDHTAEGGAVCISASGDLDGDGLTNDKDHCHHAPGGANDEDTDGAGDECDRCPIAPPRSTPDNDGDMVDAPCDPAPGETGDEIVLFDSFASGLDAKWVPTTSGAWSAANGEVTVSLASVTDQDYLQRVVPGKNNIAIEAGYRIDRVENSATQHLVGVVGDDPRPAGVATVQCGVTRADAGAGDIVVVETNQNAMNQLVSNAFQSTHTYRAGVYVTGTRAGCSVIDNGDALGVVQASITPDQLTSVALTARAVTARFQYVLVVGR